MKKADTAEAYFFPTAGTFNKEQMKKRFRDGIMMQKSEAGVNFCCTTMKKESGIDIHAK